MNILGLVIALFMWISCETTSATDLLCGTKQINSSTEICCNGLIHQKIKNSKEMGCCTRSGKGELYPIKEKICCGEQLVPNPKEPNSSNRKFKCCNKELISSKTADCCGNEDFGVKYTKSDILCCTDTKTHTFGLFNNPHSKDRCCGIKKYNKVTEKCYPGENDTFYVKPISLMKPCGQGNYNPAISLCCDKTGMVIKKPKVDHQGGVAKKWVCWNDKAYDSRMYYLHEASSRVIVKGTGLCGNQTYSERGSEVKCCDDKLYPIDSRMNLNLTCCGNNLWNLNNDSVTCCDNKFISTTTQQCCNGVPFNKGGNHTCCGTALIDKTRDICCRTQTSYETVIHKEQVNHTKCCKSETTDKIQTYNEYTQVCKRGEVHDELPQYYTPPTTTSNTPTYTNMSPPDRKQCPFCSTLKDGSICIKANVYKFFVYSERKTTHGTILNGIILQPYMKSGREIIGEKVNIRTRTQCDCFRVKKNYHLFTNRKIKSFHGKRYNIRFTADDVFIPSDKTDSVSECLTFQELYFPQKKGH